MAGKATDWSGSHPHTMTNEELLSFWRLSNPPLELRIRRVRSVHSWARRPLHHLQVLCVLFWELPNEQMGPLGDSG
eukprot:2346645-Pyramimonas_sp.AAC.1